METGKEQFTIEAAVHGKPTQLQVVSDETTDGITFYKCSSGSKEITELRYEEGYWKQIWGDLPDEEVKGIGAVIDSWQEKNKITS
ncbi:hypothetical protein [Niabella beijingensis]|uniref:hypothetical protein n=1 Tax=Niabella beijingensis TaxID=2872700 RepID=UPI001CBFA6D6|nr:hypothetical protein [Niabella beijingensis]